MSNTFSNPQFERVAPELVEKARAFQSAILCDVFGRRGTLNARVQALHPSMKVAGPAFTVEVRPGDNLMFHVALALAKPGDVIIVDGKGDDTCALFGELMVAQSEAVRRTPVWSSTRHAGTPTRWRAACSRSSPRGATLRPDERLGRNDGETDFRRRGAGAAGRSGRR